MHPEPNLANVSPAEMALMRRKKNADAQAAFRRRRANYIATLEETVTNLEGVVRSLQETIAETRDETEDLRRENVRITQENQALRKALAARDSDPSWTSFHPQKQPTDMSHAAQPIDPYSTQAIPIPRPPTTASSSANGTSVSVASTSSPATSSYSSMQLYPDGAAQQHPCNILCRPAYPLGRPSSFQLPPSPTDSQPKGMDLHLSGNTPDGTDVSHHDASYPSFVSQRPQELAWSEADVNSSQALSNSPFASVPGGSGTHTLHDGNNTNSAGSRVAGALYGPRFGSVMDSGDMQLHMDDSAATGSRSSPADSTDTSPFSPSGNVPFMFPTVETPSYRTYFPGQTSIRTGTSVIPGSGIDDEKSDMPDDFVPASAGSHHALTFPGENHTTPPGNNFHSDLTHQTHSISQGAQPHHQQRRHTTATASSYDLDSCPPSPLSSPPLASPSSSRSLRGQAEGAQNQQGLSDTLAVIKAHAFGGMRKARARSARATDEASRAAMSALAVRGLNTGGGPLSAGSSGSGDYSPQAGEKRKKLHHGDSMGSAGVGANMSPGLIV